MMLSNQLSMLLQRALTAVSDLLLTAFYLLAAQFMRRFPKLARPVVYYCLYAYFLLRDWGREHRVALQRATLILAHVFCIAIVPALLLLLSQAITFQSFSAACAWLFSHGEAAALTCLFFAAVLLSFRSLFKGYAFGVTLCSFLVAAASLINHYKTVLNGFPLMLSDLSFFSGFHDIVAYAMPDIVVSPLNWMCLFLFLVLILISIPVSRRIPAKKVHSFVALSLTLPLLLTAFGPSAIAMEAARLTEDCATQEERLEQFGVLGGLYGAYTNSKNADHSAYNTDNVNRLNNLLYLEKIAQEKARDTDVKPHIIFFLSESFFDVTRYDDVVFAEDPVPVFHSLSETHTNGQFISSTYAGGTGYVELELLTGLSNFAVKETDTLCSLKREDGNIYTQLPSIARDLSEGNGYESIYIHAHNSTLYERDDIMSSLGFDEVVFDSDFQTGAAHDGYYISDQALVKEIIYRFEHRTEDKPLFIQATSMENHRPYTAEKYADEAPVEFSYPGLSREEQIEMNAFLQGLTHADAALGQLVEYFETCGEPVMLVFYGDHLPTMQMSDSSLFYATLGKVASNDSAHWTTEELKEMLSTDYLLWTNYEESPMEDHLDSSLFLGAKALLRTGVELSPFLHWLAEDASADYISARPRLYVSADGSAHAAPEGPGAETLSDHELMTYDLIYGEQWLADYFTVKPAS